MKAWLITKKSELDNMEKVALILNSKIKSEFILKIVDILYLNSLPLDDLLYCLKRKKEMLFVAKYKNSHGIFCMWEITCGHRSEIYARLVDDVSYCNNNIKYKEPMPLVKSDIKDKRCTFISRPIKYNKIFTELKYKK